mgnify:CR=1 FL=1
MFFQLPDDCCYNCGMVLHHLTSDNKEKSNPIGLSLIESDSHVLNMVNQ